MVNLPEKLKWVEKKHSGSSQTVIIFLEEKYKYVSNYFLYFEKKPIFFAGKAAIEIDDERTTTLIQKVNELLEAFIGIHDLDLGK